jgi:hypothetical protein
MTIKLTRDEIIALVPCNLRKVPDFGRRKYMTASQALAAGAPIVDILWVAAKIGRRDICVRFAVECARRVAGEKPDRRILAALDEAIVSIVEFPSTTARLRRLEYLARDAKATANKFYYGTTGEAACQAALCAFYEMPGSIAEAAFHAAVQAREVVYKARGYLALRDETHEQEQLLIRLCS